MTWLARLKKADVSPDAHPTKTTETLFVVSVGTPAGTFEYSRGDSRAANDTGTDLADPNITLRSQAAPDPDRWCWPHSTAMNGAEIDTFTQRLHQFTWRGLAELEAETLADKLVIRDRESDDRRLCLECSNLSRAGGWRCAQWQRAGLGAAGVPADLVRQLQRCDSFNHTTPNRGHDGKTTHA